MCMARPICLRSTPPPPHFVSQVDAASSATSIGRDLSLDWDEFLLSLHRLVRVKFPSAAAAAVAADKCVST